MNCTECQQLIQRYLDNDLSASECAAFSQAHQACADCASLLESEQSLRAALQDLPAPQLALSRKEAMLERAMLSSAETGTAHSSEPSHQQSWISRVKDAVALPWAPELSMAIGMLLGIALTLTLGPSTPSSPPDNALAAANQPAKTHEGLGQIQLQISQETVLRLKIASTTAMDEVEFAIDLPAGLEFVEYPNIRQLRWSGRLAQGINYLPLPVRALKIGSGEVKATVADTSGQRTFAIQYQVVEQEVIEQAEGHDQALNQTNDRIIITAADSTRTS